MSSVPAVSQLQMRSLPTDIDAGTLRERVIEVTHQHLLKLRKELEAALRLFELETVKSALTLQVPLRAGAGPSWGGHYAGHRNYNGGWRRVGLIRPGRTQQAPRPQKRFRSS